MGYNLCDIFAIYLDIVTFFYRSLLVFFRVKVMKNVSKVKAKENWAGRMDHHH